jgi:hypothetical protein
VQIASSLPKSSAGCTEFAVTAPSAKESDFGWSVSPEHLQVADGETKQLTVTLTLPSIAPEEFCAEGQPYMPVMVLSARSSHKYTPDKQAAHTIVVQATVKQKRDDE